jgi:hypothetical protein
LGTAVTRDALSRPRLDAYVQLDMVLRHTVRGRPSEDRDDMGGDSSSNG